MGEWRWQRVQRKKQLGDGLALIRQEIGIPGKPILAYVVPYDIVKLQTGGGKRIAGIARALGAEFRVFILSLSPGSRPFSVKGIAPGVWMVAIPASEEFEESAREQTVAGGGAAPLFAFADHFEQLPEFHAVLGALSRDVRTWALSSPMAWPPVQRFFMPDRQRLIYDVHDDLPRFLGVVLGCTDGPLLERAEAMEGEVLKQASHAAFCTAEDAAATRLRHPEAREKIVMVPNGVDVEACHAAFPAQAGQNRQMAGVDRPVVLFAGAHHKPNYEAVDWIAREWAPMFPRALFVVMGMHLAPYRESGGAEPGANMVFTGPVSEEIKEAVFSLAEVALAPMKSGTGSSLKIPDYIAHGKIVVGTSLGLRGFEAGKGFPSIIVSENIGDDLERVLTRLAEAPDAFTDSCRRAREWVASTLDWAVAARPLVEALKVQIDGVVR